MIDGELIMMYTEALYSTPAESLPRYEEFRDMFSSGQLKSKLWLLKELHRYSAIVESSSIAVVGAWFGTLGIMLARKYPAAKLTLVDIDPRCAEYLQSVIYRFPKINSITCDMYEYEFNEQVIINTSCEHIADLTAWVNILPDNTTVVLQSNNFLDGNDHISCVSSVEELSKLSGLKSIWYEGELVLPMYTRYMIIGRT